LEDLYLNLYDEATENEGFSKLFQIQMLNFSMPRNWTLKGLEISIKKE